MLPTRVDMILWAPETKEYPYKPVHLQIWFLTNQLSVRTWRQFEEESDILATRHQAELYLWNQSDLFLLFSVWLSGRFLFITWCPPPAHPLSPRNDLLTCLVWPVLHNPLSCHNDVWIWSVNIIKSLCMPFEYFLEISWAF